jgi:hypothetical protein
MSYRVFCLNTHEKANQETEVWRLNEPVCGLGGEHRTDEIYRLQTFFSKALQAVQRLLVPQNVDLALEPVTKRMSTIRERIIVKATEREYVNRFCQSRRRPPRSRVIAPGGSPDAVVGALGVVVGDRVIEFDIAPEDFRCPPSKRPYSNRTARSRQEARLI